MRKIKPYVLLKIGAFGNFVTVWGCEGPDPLTVVCIYACI